MLIYCVHDSPEGELKYVEEICSKGNRTETVRTGFEGSRSQGIGQPSFVDEFHDCLNLPVVGA